MEWDFTSISCNLQRAKPFLLLLGYTLEQHAIWWWWPHQKGESENNQVEFVQGFLFQVLSIFSLWVLCLPHPPTHMHIKR